MRSITRPLTDADLAQRADLLHVTSRGAVSRRQALTLEQLDQIIAQSAVDCGICPELPCSEQHMQDDVDTRSYARSMDEAFPDGRAFYVDNRPAARVGRLVDRALAWLGQPVRLYFLIGLGAACAAAAVALGQLRGMLA